MRITKHVKTALSIAALSGCLAADGGTKSSPLPSWIKIAPDGSFSINEMQASVIHYNKDWRGSLQEKHLRPDKGQPQVKDGNWQLKGELPLNKQNIAVPFTQSITTINNTTIEYKASINISQAADTREISLYMKLPTKKTGGRKLLIDGKAIELPVEYKENNWKLFSGDKVTKIEIPLSAGRLTIEGDFNVLLQDSRRFSVDAYTLRLRFIKSPSDKSINSFNAKIIYNAYTSTPVNFSKQANMSFTDKVAEDGKGGWTDQGPENDLRIMPLGKRKFGNVEFNIIDPAKNNNKSCIVLAGEQRPAMLREVVIPMNGQSFKYLYFLHATAWSQSVTAPIGSITARYTDGTESELEVISNKDVGDWWGAYALGNAEVIWTAENRSTYVGLYLTRFELQPKPIRSLKINSNGKCVWMIAGISGTDNDIPRLQNISPQYIVSGKDWKAIEFKQDIVPGSAMDFSFLIDHAPAGKYGFLKANNKGEFVFENAPDKKMRFFGTNINATVNLLDKEWVDTIAERFVRSGYNVLRFHHFDNMIVNRNLETTTELNPEALDKLDYFFYALKQRGIYITIDLYCSRVMKPADVPEVNKELRHLTGKGTFYIFDSALDNWKSYVSNLLNHVNPYTGLAWKDDPAITFVNLVNENNLNHVWNNEPVTEAAYEKMFKEWIKDNPGTANLATDRRRDLFLMERYLITLKKMRAHLKDLGAKTMITDMNYRSDIFPFFARNHYDLVDNHFYHSHPKFLGQRWRLPVSLANRSSINVRSGVQRMFGSRIFGKPFTITEFNHAAPDVYRAEGGIVTGAYAALQGWNGLYRFAYSHHAYRLMKPHGMNFFDTAHDPIGMIGDRIGAIILLRGDVKESEITIPCLVPENYMRDPAGLKDQPSHAINNVGLFAKTGSVLWKAGASLPENTIAVMGVGKPVNPGVPYFSIEKADAFEKIVKAGLIKANNGSITSSTGELEINSGAGYFKMRSPRSEGCVLPGKMDFKGNFMQVVNKDGFAVLFVTSLDGKDLKNSHRILLAHMTDVQNNKTKFRDKRMNILESGGELPLLAKRGNAEITLNTRNGDKVEIWAIDLDGRRISQVKTQVTSNGVAFTADTFAFKQPVFLYELTR
jgi:hypothetical protein